MKLWILIFCIVLASSLVHAEENKSAESSAFSCLQESSQIMQELIAENFSVQRVNDSLKQAENLYNAQLALQEKKSSYDFSLVLPYCQKIKDMKEGAFEARDEFFGLKRFYESSITPEMKERLSMSPSSLDESISEIENEIESERYEKVKPLIDRAYQDIINAKSSYTTLNVFYSSTTRSLKSFFSKNWILISSVSGVLVFLLLVYRVKISKMIIERKIKKLEIRKDTLKSLIMQAQKAYFTFGKVSEGTYRIRIKKFAEMIRDIDRQIPLLNEQMAKIDKKKDKK